MPILAVILTSVALLSPASVAAQESAEERVKMAAKAIKEKKWKEAVRNCTRALVLDPKNAHAYFYRGLARSHQRDYAGSIADYTKAIELNPKDPYAYHNRGESKSSNGNLDGAIADFTKAIELEPKHARPYCGRGSAKYE